jgi:hypothetical protein
MIYKFFDIATNKEITFAGYEAGGGYLMSQSYADRGTHNIRLEVSAPQGPFNTLTDVVIKPTQGFTYTFENEWDPCFNTTLDTSVTIKNMEIFELDKVTVSQNFAEVTDSYTVEQKGAADCGTKRYALINPGRY